MRFIAAFLAFLALSVIARAETTIIGSGVFGWTGAATGMITPMTASISLPTSGTATEYAPIQGSGTLSTNTTTANVRAIPIPIAGVISGLYSNLTVSQFNVTTSAFVTDRVNGANKTLTCSFSAVVAPYSCFDSVHTDAINAGDLVQWVFSPGSSTWAQTVDPNQVSLVFTSTSPNQGMLLSGTSNSAVPAATAAVYQGFGTVSNNITTASSIMPVAGQITGIYATPNVSENASFPHTYTVYHNGASTGISCIASTTTVTAGCCANLTGSGVIGGTSVSCGTISAITIAAGDTLSAQVSCHSVPTNNCNSVLPGISLIWVPSTAGQAVVTTQFTSNVSVTEYMGISDNTLFSSQTTYQLIPYLGVGGSMTLSNLIACTGISPGGTAARTFTTQSATTPGTAPTTTAGGPVTVLSVANGACPGAMSAALLGGNQDTTHTIVVGSGYSVDTVHTPTGSPAGGAAFPWKISYAATVTP